jgi:predicted GIY-YIG superfamily endonuclease
MSGVSGIYVIVNTKNGKVYVGQTQDFKERWQQHKTDLRGNYHENRYLQSAWNKYGEKAFKFIKLEYCTIDQLKEREQHHIDIYWAKGVCYNLAKDVRSPMRGLKHTEETKLRMSELHKNPSEETRRKMSVAAKARKRIPLSEETKRKMSQSLKGRSPTFLGRNHTEETKHKIGASKQGGASPFLGKKHSEETKNKLSEIAKMQTFSDEHRRKISEANTGRKHTEETRHKISEARKAYFARERGELNDTE